MNEELTNRSCGTKLIIDRKTWWMGKNYGNSRLLRDDGYKCCLGFYALQQGCKETEILNVLSPAYVLVRLRHKFKALLTDDGFGLTDLCGELIYLNDEPHVENREEKLTEKFKEMGVEVEFIN